ncbi:hypothetical protein JCM11251_002089 [Rhodosporidiobolus azoricus]
MLAPASLLVLAAIAVASPTPQLDFNAATAGGQVVIGGLPDIPHHEFNPLDEMASVAPYHDAPGANINPPDGCKVSAAAFLIRHSSIGGNDEEWEEFMQPFVEKVNSKRHLAIHPTSPLSFLSSWESPVTEDTIEKLTGPGEEDAYSFGKRLRHFYDPLLPPKNLGRKGRKAEKAGKKVKEPFKIWTASSGRDIGTARAWIKGAFPSWQGGKNGEGDGKYISLVKVPNKDENWSISLTPHKICDAFSKERGKAEAQAWLEKFGPPAVERMNQFAPGYDFNLTDVIAAQMMCGYETVISKKRSSPFCSTELFTPEEFKAHGYWHDLHWHYSVGYGAPYSPYLGAGWLNTSTHNLLSAYADPHPHPNASSLFLPDKKLPPPSAPPNGTHTQLVFIYVTHREEPAFALTALGLWNMTDDQFPTDRNPEDRVFKSSHIIPFLGHVALERMSCEADKENDYIRVMVNGAPQLLESCQDGPGGSCRMDLFEEFVKERTERYKDFDGACKKPEGDEE